MIKLPKFTLQSMFDSETDFSLQAPGDRLAKLLIHYEAFKLIKNLKGSIVEWCIQRNIYCKICRFKKFI